MDLPELIKRFRFVCENAAQVEPDSIIAAMGQAADALERLQAERDELAEELWKYKHSEAEVWD